MFSSTLTRDGRPLTSCFAEEPFRSVVADNRIGNPEPSMPAPSLAEGLGFFEARFAGPPAAERPLGTQMSTAS